jgi:hypothetical protein
MAELFTALATRILKKKAPSSNRLAVAGALGGLLGSEAGGALGSRAGARRVPTELGEKLKNVATRDKELLSAFPGEGSTYEKIQAATDPLEDKLDFTLTALTSAEEKALRTGQLAKHLGKYQKGGSIAGGLIGGLAAPSALNALHQARVQRLAKKLAVGTAGVGATGGLAGLLAYRHKQKQAGAITRGLKAIGARLNPFNVAGSVRAGAANKAIAAGTQLMNPPTAITGLSKAAPMAGAADDVARQSGQIYEGSVGSRLADIDGTELTSPQGIFNKRAPVVNTGSHYFDAGANSYFPVQPRQPFRPNQPLYKAGPDGTFNEYMRIDRPVRLPNSIPTAPRGVAPTAPPVPLASAPAPATPLPPSAATPPAGAVAGATGLAGDAAEAAAQGGSLKPWLDSIAGANPQAAKFISEWGPTITATAAPLVALWGEKQAVRVALQKTMEQAVPYAAGGLAVGAGFGMLSNRNER